MKPESIAYLLNMLNAQYAHIATQSRISKAAGERQRLYYTGAYTAVNAAISEAFTLPVTVSVSPDGKHSVERCPD